MSAWFRTTPAIAEELDVATTAPGQDHRDFLATEGAAVVGGVHEFRHRQLLGVSTMVISHSSSWKLV